MDNSLKILFDIQSKHNQVWQDKDRFDADKEYRIKVMKDFILGLNKQISELLGTFNWGEHILDQTENVLNSKIQIIDIVKYAFAFFIMLGGDEKEFVELFIQKSDELDERWRQSKMKLLKNTKVMIFDIDGVIADYTTEYDRFLRDVCKLKSSVPLDKRTSYSFCEYYGITRQEEEFFNQEFIKSGGFLNLKVYDGVKEIIDELKSIGIKIILITARPNWIHKRLTMDTIQWLKNNEINYDLLFWNKDKADVIINNIFPSCVLFMVEDRDKHAIEVTHIGVDVLLIDKPYNKNVSSPIIHRLNNFSEIKSYVDCALTLLG